MVFFHNKNTFFPQNSGGGGGGGQQRREGPHKYGDSPQCTFLLPQSKEPRLARVPPTPSHRTPSDAVPSNPIDGAPPVKVDAEPRPRRTYQPPVRDEESESQRKARSRMMRQSRRSTQGVTLTELKEAEKAIGHIGEEQPIREGERRDEQPPESTDPSRRPTPPSPPSCS